MMRTASLLFLIVIPSTLMSQTISPSTIGEVFNFEIGDSFQYQFSRLTLAAACNCQEKVFYTITDKQVLPDTIVYGYSVVSQIAESHPGNCSSCYTFLSTPFYRFSVDFNTFRITRLDSSIFTIYNSGFGCPNDTSTGTDSSYLATLGALRRHNVYDHGCFNGILETTAEGMGVVSSSIYLEGYHERDECSLIYYHKANGQQWGTFVSDVGETGELDRTIVNAITTANRSIEITISDWTTPVTWHLRSSLGSEILTTNLTSAVTSYDLNHLATGMYLWTAESNGKTLGYGKILLVD